MTKREQAKSTDKVIKGPASLPKDHRRPDPQNAWTMDPNVGTD